MQFNFSKERRLKLDKIDKKVKSESNVSFINLIDSYLKHRNNFKEYKMLIKRNTLAGFHPSQIAYICPRAMGFNLLYELGMFSDNALEECNFNIKVNNPDLEFTFDVGHIIHGLIQYSYLSGIKNLEYSVENPVDKLHKKYWISGTNDIEIVLQDKKRWIVDIKTANLMSFNKINKASDIDIGYLIQANLYMYGKKIPRFIFLFVNKNTTRPKMKEFFYEYDSYYVKFALKKALSVKNWLLRKKEISILPECKKLSGRYETCPFSSICFRTKSSEDLSKITKHKNNYLSTLKNKMPNE